MDNVSDTSSAESEPEDTTAVEEVAPSKTTSSKPEEQTQKRPKSKYKNKQRTLVFGTRGVSGAQRHLLNDLRDLLPHSKREPKLDLKRNLREVNEICDMKNCNNCIFLEARKKDDLYMWVSRAPSGPSVRFHVTNIYTMAELKLTGNCLKGSRPMMVFDKQFASTPHLQLIKSLLTQSFGSPRHHPRTKPFVDHVFSFTMQDGRIWFRNYQIVYDSEKNEKAMAKPVLVEVGPRFVLNPIRVFTGSFGGATIFQNTNFVSPQQARVAIMRQKRSKYTEQQRAKRRKLAKAIDTMNKPPKPLADVFYSDSD